MLELRECFCGWWIAAYGAWECERECPLEACAAVLAVCAEETSAA